VQKDGNPALTLDDCYDYVEQKVFALQPGSYGREYPNWPGMVGLELEVLVLQQGRFDRRGFPLLAPLNGPKPSVSEFLLEMATSRPGWAPELLDADDSNAGLARVELEKGDQITFEPGGQLEFSSVPYPCLGDALERLCDIQTELDSAAQSAQIELCQLGINPWQSVSEIGLQMNKPRYRAMDQHFASIGPYGQRMMRQTCTLQVNLDFGPSETTLTKRFVAAQLVAPFATAVFANSPYVDGKKTEYLSFRSRIWQDTDSSRTGFVKGDLTQGGSWSKAEVCRAYSDSVLDARVIFVTEAGYRLPEQPVSFRQWVNEPLFGYRASLEDLKTHLSLFFPEVRARGFLELRSVDAQPRSWQSIPPAFYTGLFYDDATTEELLELLLPEASNLAAHWCQSSYGLSNEHFRCVSRRVVELAMKGFSRLPSCFRENCAEAKFASFYERFTSRGRAPANDLIDFTEKAGKAVPDLSVVSALIDHWQNRVK